MKKRIRKTSSWLLVSAALLGGLVSLNFDDTVHATEQTTQSVSGQAKTEKIGVHRVYDPTSGGHLHTLNSSEKDHLVDQGWDYEGVSMYISQKGEALYRMYNPSSGEHFYTLHASERDSLQKSGWHYEGEAWKTPKTGAPMYRLFNPNAKSADSHHYTLAAQERDALVKAGWHDEGIAFHTLGGSDPIAPTTERTLNVAYVSQYQPVFAPWGCASASMAMLLSNKGVQIDLKEAQDNLPMYPQDPGGQKGNVYTGEGFGWVITPKTLADYAKRWYPDVYDFSGANLNQIRKQILNGNPVLFYGYSSWQKDSVRNHCKVIVGYKDRKFLVHDPIYYNSTDGPMSGGKHPLYDRGAIYWSTFEDFAEEYRGRAVGIK